MIQIEYEHQRKQKYLSSIITNEQYNDKVVIAQKQPFDDWVDDAMHEININFIYVTHEKRQQYCRKFQQKQRQRQRRTEPSTNNNSNDV
jgi:hypothetical protein